MVKGLVEALIGVFVLDVLSDDRYFDLVFETGDLTHEVAPGRKVRRSLLESRVFLQGGLSVPHLELVLRSTGADYVLTGTVMRYLDARTAFQDPEVEFSVEMFDREGKQVVWSTRSFGRGGDGVFFFDTGRKSTASGLAEALVDRIVEGMPFEAAGLGVTRHKERISH